MSQYYSENNIKAIVPFLRAKAPRWFILGGPADGCEAQEAAKLWPGIKVIGVEPNPEAFSFQLANGWRPGWSLLRSALSDVTGERVEVVREVGKLRNASASPDSVEGNRGNVDVRYEVVPTITLDSMYNMFGPFEDAVVWLDIEGSELRAVRGGANLLASRRVLLWNVEMLSRHTELMTEIPRMMATAGYVAVAEWNHSDACRDRIFLRDDLVKGAVSGLRVQQYHDEGAPLLRLLCTPEGRPL